MILPDREPCKIRPQDATSRTRVGEGPSITWCVLELSVIKPSMVKSPPPKELRCRVVGMHRVERCICITVEVIDPARSVYNCGVPARVG